MQAVIEARSLAFALSVITHYSSPYETLWLCRELANLDWHEFAPTRDLRSPAPMPLERNEPHVVRLTRVVYKTYEEKFDDLWVLPSHKAVYSGAFDRKFEVDAICRSTEQLVPTYRAGTHHRRAELLRLSSFSLARSLSDRPCWLTSTLCFDRLPGRGMGREFRE